MLKFTDGAITLLASTPIDTSITPLDIVEHINLVLTDNNATEGFLPTENYNVKKADVQRYINLVDAVNEAGPSIEEGQAINSTPAPHQGGLSATVESARDEAEASVASFIEATRSQLTVALNASEQMKNIRRALAPSALAMVTSYLTLYKVELSEREASGTVKTDVLVPFPIESAIAKLQRALGDDARAQDELGENGALVKDDKVVTGGKASAISESGIYRTAQYVAMEALLVADVDSTSASEHPFKFAENGAFMAMVHTIVKGNERTDEHGNKSTARYAGEDANEWTCIDNTKLKTLFLAVHGTKKRDVKESKSFADAMKNVKPEDKAAISAHYKNPTTQMDSVRALFASIVNGNSAADVIDLFVDDEDALAFVSLAEDVYEKYVEACKTLAPTETQQAALDVA